MGGTCNEKFKNTFVELSTHNNQDLRNKLTVVNRDSNVLCKWLLILDSGLLSSAADIPEQCSVNIFCPKFVIILLIKITGCLMSSEKLPRLKKTRAF